MTQTIASVPAQKVISYREGKHFGTLSIDMNDPEDARFMEEFARIPSKNRDYIASLYAREKRRGVNRHVGDHIQPLSLTKQIDNVDVKKTNLNIDKNALTRTLEDIDAKIKAIKDAVDSGERTREDADIELKSLAAEREKIKARADELGIKIAALNAKSSTDGSSPLKPDQLLTIIKKLQEQGNAPDLSAVLNKIENLRLDGGGMMDYISALIDVIDKTFVYRNGKLLGLSQTVEGLTMLNRVVSDRRITKNRTQTKKEINDALATVIAIQKTPVSAITTRAGIDMSFGVAEALFKRLFGSLLMAIDFDFKDINISELRSEFIDTSAIDNYLKEIRSAVDNSMHIYTAVPTTHISAKAIESYNNVANTIMETLNRQAEAITSTDFGDRKSSFGLNLCAVLLGINQSDNAGFNTIYPKHAELMTAYTDNGIKNAYDELQSATNNSGNYTQKTVIPAAFNAVRAAEAAIDKKFRKANDLGITYNRSTNSINIGSQTIRGVFEYKKPDSGSNNNIIATGITKDDIIEIFKRRALENISKRKSIEISSEYEYRHNPKLETGDATNTVDTGLEAPNSVDNPLEQSALGKVPQFVPDDALSEDAKSKIAAKDWDALRKDPSYQKKAMELAAVLSNLPGNALGELLITDWVVKNCGEKSGDDGAGIRRRAAVNATHSSGAAGYIKVIDRGNPLLYKRH